jgi:hypothetical protein
MTRLHHPRTVLICLAVLSALGFAAAPQAQASVTLIDQNSTAGIDPNSQAGVFNWTVDGKNNLFQQWFWYRIGDDPTGQHSIDTISAPTVTPFLGTRGVDIAYSNGTLGAEVNYILTGGSAGSGTSALSEVVRLTNTSSSSITLHFFQYSDFDLSGTPDGDSVALTDHKATQGGPGKLLSETVVTPDASRLEANIFANTLNSLNSGAPYDLNNVATAGPGDVTWAYQWDVTLSEGGTFLISKVKQLQPIPEPSTLAIAGLAGLGLALYGFCRSRKG